MSQSASTKKRKTMYTDPRAGSGEIFIDASIFEELCRIQCTQLEICSVLNVSDEKLAQWCRKTYKVNFSEISKVFRSEGNTSLRRRQFLNAQSGDTKMLIWLGRNWLKQTDKQESPEDEEPPEPVQIVIQGYDASVNNQDE